MMDEIWCFLRINHSPKFRNIFFCNIYISFKNIYSAFQKKVLIFNQKKKDLKELYIHALMNYMCQNSYNQTIKNTNIVKLELFNCSGSHDTIKKLNRLYFFLQILPESLLGSFQIRAFSYF